MDNHLFLPQSSVQLHNGELYTTGQLVNAVASLATRVGSTPEEIVRKTNLGTRALVSNPTAEIQGLSAYELVLLDYELRQELSKCFRWFGSVDSDEGVALRIAPAADAKLIALLPQKTLVEVVSHTSHWLYVCAASGSGYVLKGTIVPLSQKVVGMTPWEETNSLAEQESATRNTLRSYDSKLHDALQLSIQNGLQKNDMLLNTVRCEAMNLYRKILWVYRVLFLLGVSAFAASILLAYLFRDSPTMLVSSVVLMGGIAFVAFLIFFATRPLSTLRRYHEYNSWLDSADMAESSHRFNSSDRKIG